MIQATIWVYINEEQIKQVVECQYLDILIDENLSFSSHASYITSKIAKKVNLLCRLRHVSTWTKLLIYKTIILSHLNFCATILYLLNNTQIHEIQKKNRESSTTDHFKVQ